MASTKGPLMSLDASGTVAGTITFAKWKGRNYVRQTVIPANPKTAAQEAVRAVMRYLTQTFALLTAGEKAAWATAAEATSVTALNADVSHNMDRFAQGLGVTDSPDYTPGAVEAAPTGGAVTAQVKSLKITWTDSAGADDRCTWIYRSTTNNFTPGTTNLVRIIRKGTQQYIDAGLETGTTYYYRLQGCEKGGTLGTLAAQISGVPD